MPFGKSFYAVLAVLRKSALSAESAGKERLQGISFDVLPP